MKKLLVVLLAVFSVFGLTACNNEVLASENKDYYVTGNFNGWAAKDDAKMTAIAISDDRVASIKKELKGVEVLYLLEVTLPSTLADWSVGPYTIDGEEVSVNGNLTVKVIRTAKDDKDVVDFWAQNKESGKITNITPDTLYIPTYAETVTDGSGTWADNPIAYEAGTYYVIFAEKGAGLDAVRMLGLIKKA